MKREFLHDDLEDFLKRSADSLRMKAPDKVWQNISKDLGGRRRRLLAGLGAFLLLTSAAGYFIVSKTTQQSVSASEQSNNQTTAILRTDAAKDLGTQRPSTLPAPVIPLQAYQRRPSLLTTKPSLTEKGNVGTVIPLFGKTQENKQPSNTALDGVNNVGRNSFEPIPVDSYTEFDESNSHIEGEKEQTKRVVGELLPYSIESVVNTYKGRNDKKRFQTQLYFTPTISYRKLAENKSYLRSLGLSASSASYAGLNSSVNNNVTHKPDLGFELGFGAKYAVSSKVKLRTGVQFNVNRYDVKAFSAGLSQATIALNNGSRVDSLNTYSRYSNVGGYKSNWLQNLSFQLSVPVGVEYLFAGADDIQFGVAGTVQPTYVLGDRAYLITTDYKNYTQVPWLIRRWNVNTSFEAFVNYKRWQFGPQVRYQLLSSFVSKYPVKENLFDFGLKVGILLNK